MANNDLIKRAFNASSPALFGYISLGISFGFIFEKMGGVWYLAPLMSLLVYAGAAQFVALSLLATQGSLLQIASVTLFVNLRHIFYGLSFLGKFPKSFFKKVYMVFGLTDESYSILTCEKDNGKEDFAFYVILFSHAYWVVGTLIGAMLGNLITFDLSFLKFTLTALFVVLSVEQFLGVKKFFPFIVGGISCLIGYLILPDEMLIIALIISTLTLVIFYYARVKANDS